ncbi:hypothetical protein HQ36_07215 [Porphyromonas gingivicanis]|uniref:Uncharacterized protein n=1 Tax=Porphyromonas gingivicanis TaxID=266762 RepID=A0A0A2G4S4_9PORP|nr:hypothetical protein HQ36_07215 [Porphyromonas gingivicanis]
MGTTKHYSFLKCVAKVLFFLKIANSFCESTKCFLLITSASSLYYKKTHTASSALIYSTTTIKVISRLPLLLTTYDQ